MHLGADLPCTLGGIAIEERHTALLFITWATLASYLTFLRLKFLIWKIMMLMSTPEESCAH